MKLPKFHCDPTFGTSMSLQKATKVVAILQIIYSSLLTVAIGVAMVLRGVALEVAVMRSTRRDKDESSLLNHSSHSSSSSSNFSGVEMEPPCHGLQLSIAIFVAYVVIFVITALFLIVDVELLKGANRRNVGKCRVWVSMRCIRLMFAMVILIAALYKNHLAPCQIFAVVEIITDVYCLWVVQGLVKEMKAEEYEEGKKGPVPGFTPEMATKRNSKVTFEAIKY